MDLKKKLNKIENVDVIFLSCFDHNEGTNNHGLFQMFEFFKQNVDTKALFLSTMQGIYKNDIDVFDIGHLGESLKLAHQINSTFASFVKDSPHLWMNKFSNKEEFATYASKILIQNLPNHKFIALSDKVDIDLLVLEKVLKHFKSKVIILSAASNTWTGYCSYPDEFNCDKYKTKQGCCSPCPAINNKSEIVARNKVDNDFVKTAFNDTRDFVNRNKGSVLLNVGSSYSLQEANESFLFKDVEKCLITLKNSYLPDSFEDLWAIKKENRNKLLNNLQKNNNKDLTKNVKFIVMWSAHDIVIKRKGIDYFINSLMILKYFLKFQRLQEVLLIISCKLSDDKAVESLKELGFPIIFTNHIDKKNYDFLLSSSDVYCSTTLSDAGPRTIFESAGVGTPVISFDKCIASDLINDNNGALIPTYDVKKMAEEMYRFANYSDDERKEISKNLYDDYNSLMDTNRLKSKWETFLKNHAI